MSFARDPLQEVKKIDSSIASRIEGLYLDPAENMLLGAIILDSIIPINELISRLNRLLKRFSRNQYKERLKEYYFLIHGKESLSEEESMSYHESMKKLLRELPQSINRDISRDRERVKTIKVGMSMAAHGQMWTSNRWKNTIQSMTETKNPNNVKVVKLQPPTDESYFMPTRYMADKKEREEKIPDPTFGAIRCLTCTCYHAPGYCPVIESQSRPNSLKTSAIKIIRSHLGLR